MEIIESDIKVYIIIRAVCIQGMKQIEPETNVQ